MATKTTATKTVSKTSKVTAEQLLRKESFPFERPSAKTPFETTRVGPVRKSDVVTPKGLAFEDAWREIRVLSSDGKMRRCKIDRLEDEAARRHLWTLLSKAVRNEANVRFKSAGGFSPDMWFYDIEIVD